MKFNKTENKTWELLFERQWENVEKHASKMILEGFKILDMPRTEIPSREFLHSKVNPRTGWSVVETNVRYMAPKSWVHHLVRKEFPISTFIRDQKELDFTPEPDLFHDVFGHMPQNVFPQFMDLLAKFGLAFANAKNEEEKKDISRLAWFSYEFGLIQENGQVKAFGTGLISSKAELEKVMSGGIDILPFTIENVTQREKAILDLNKELFIFESFEALVKELDRFLLPIIKRNSPLVEELASMEVVAEELKF